MTTEVRRSLAAVPNRTHEAEAEDSAHRSGLRPATRVPSAENEDEELISVLVEAHTGHVAGLAGDECRVLDDFRATVPELFSPAVHLTLGAESAPLELRDLVLVSPKRVHVAQRVPRDPKLVLVSVSNRSKSLGLVVSETRARLRDA
jgi:hypothetical protein